MRLARTLFRWLAAVRRDERLSMGAVMAAHVLTLDFMNWKTGRCDPSINAIAKILHRSARMVERDLKELRVNGWLIAEYRDGTSNSYELNLVMTPDTGDTPTPDTGDTPTPVKDVADPRHGCHPNFRRTSEKDARAREAARLRVENAVWIAAESPEGDFLRRYWNDHGRREPMRVHGGNDYAVQSDDPALSALEIHKGLSNGNLRR
jgi:hypothetical protein